MYNKIEHFEKWSIFVSCLMSSFANTTSPRRPLHMLYVYIATIYCQKGILGLGAHLKQTERRQFHLFNDKHRDLKCITYACAEGIPHSFGNEGHLYD